MKKLKKYFLTLTFATLICLNTAVVNATEYTPESLTTNKENENKYDDSIFNKTDKDYETNKDDLTYTTKEDKTNNNQTNKYDYLKNDYNTTNENQTNDNKTNDNKENKTDYNFDYLNDNYTTTNDNKENKTNNDEKNNNETNDNKEKAQYTKTVEQIDYKDGSKKIITTEITNKNPDNLIGLKEEDIVKINKTEDMNFSSNEK